MVDEAVMKAILDTIEQADDAIGRDIAARLGVDPASAVPAAALIAIATAHMIAARRLLRLAGGARLVAAVFSRHAASAAE